MVSYEVNLHMKSFYFYVRTKRNVISRFYCFWKATQENDRRRSERFLDSHLIVPGHPGVTLLADHPPPVPLRLHRLHLDRLLLHLQRSARGEQVAQNAFMS